jgi:NADPH-dependent ferric siderophore reductase
MSVLGTVAEPAETLTPPNFRAARVVGVSDVTPRMRRLTLAADDIARFDAHDLHVKLLIPRPGRPLVRPIASAGGVIWPGEGEVSVRTYTIRRIDVASGRIDIDMVRHADGGPGARFAETARPGDVLGLMGPGGRNVERADWTLLAGDETALPAIGRILEALPHDATGLALISTEDEADRQELQAPQGFTIRWLRHGAAQGATAGLLDAVHAAAPPERGSVFAWAGAEFETIQAIRTHWRGLGLSKERQLAVAYWRRGRAMDTRP